MTAIWVSNLRPLGLESKLLPLGYIYVCVSNNLKSSRHWSSIVIQRLINNHTSYIISTTAKCEADWEATEYWSNLMWQFRLLHPSQIWGITRDGKGCHHLPPTPQPWKGPMHSPVSPYPSTMLAYIETTQIPLGPWPYGLTGKELEHT
jgi:hypothetical protein